MFKCVSFFTLGLEAGAGHHFVQNIFCQAFSIWILRRGVRQACVPPLVVRNLTSELPPNCSDLALNAPGLVRTQIRTQIKGNIREIS